jgi:hypothetical protein
MFETFRAKKIGQDYGGSVPIQRCKNGSSFVTNVMVNKTNIPGTSAFSMTGLDPFLGRRSHYIFYVAYSYSRSQLDKSLPVHACRMLAFHYRYTYSTSTGMPSFSYR